MHATEGGAHGRGAGLVKLRAQRWGQWAAVGTAAPLAQVKNGRRRRAGHGGARAWQGRGGGWEDAHCRE